MVLWSSVLTEYSQQTRGSFVDENGSEMTAVAVVPLPSWLTLVVEIRHAQRMCDGEKYRALRRIVHQ